MSIGMASKSLFSKKSVCNNEEFDEQGLQDDFVKMLEQYPVTSYEGKIVNGVIVNIDDKGRSGKVLFDIGSKTEGYISLRALEQIDEETDDNDDNDGSVEKKKHEVGDLMRLYVEEGDLQNGYINLNREKVLRQEMWEVLEQKFKDNEIINGYIVNKVKCGFIVDLYGTVAFLPGSQLDLRSIADVTPLLGRKQPFLILKMDKVQGNIVVSRRAVLENNFNKKREHILNTIEEGQIVEGVVKNITKYGVFIDLGGLDGLAHLVDLSWKKINHPFEVVSVGQKVRVKVIKFNKENKRISLGMKQLEESPWDKVHENYPIGSKHKAMITSIADYGLFAELKGDMGVEGLVYQNDISWSRKVNNNPAHFFHKGQDIDIKVLDIDVEKLRISLSCKECIENPWTDFANKYSSGQVIDVVVKYIADFGIFVDLPHTIEGAGAEASIEGLVHCQDLCSNKDYKIELKKFKKGDKIKVKILTINPEKERISLGVKQMEFDPMEELIGSLNIGQIIDGVVVNIMNNDIYLELSEGVEVIISKSDFANEKDKLNILNSVNLYSKLELKIINIIPKQRFIKFDVMRKN